MLVFQAVISWTAEDGSLVHRSVTRQIPVSQNRDAVFQTLDCEVAGLLLAKRVIQRGRASGAASNKKTAERLRADIGMQAVVIAWSPLNSPRGRGDG